MSYNLTIYSNKILFIYKHVINLILFNINRQYCGKWRKNAIFLLKL